MNERWEPPTVEMWITWSRDATLPQDRKDAAWTAMRGWVDEQAHNLARRREFAGLDPVAAANHVMDQLEHYVPTRGSFRAWSGRSLRNHLVDQGRKRKRHLRRVSAANRPTTVRVEGDDGEGAGEKLRNLLRLQREELDRVACEEPASSTDFFAVFLMSLRLSLWNRTQIVLEEVLRGPRDPSVSEFIEQSLPWRKNELSRRFRNGLADLQTLWSRLGPVLDSNEAGLNGSRFCSIVNEASGREASLSPDLWHQWKKRAKQFVRERIDASEWDALFATIIPGQ